MSRPINPDSKAQTQPWLEKGLSRTQYYARLRHERLKAEVTAGLEIDVIDADLKIMRRIEQIAVELGVPSALLMQVYVMFNDTEIPSPQMYDIRPRRPVTT